MLDAEGKENVASTILKEADEETQKQKKKFECAPHLAGIFKGGNNPDENGLACAVVLVTPMRAKLWLEKNHIDQRSLSAQRITSFIADLKSGNWALTHQAVCFDGEGTLIDGQHRLYAIVQSGIAAKMLVVRNQHASFHDPIDRGAPRSVATILREPSRVTAAYNTLRMLENGGNLTSPMTLAEAQVIQARYKEAFQGLEVIHNRNKLHGGFLGALVWALPCAPDAVIAFGQQVATGEMLRRGDAAWAFRNWKERNTRVESWLLALATLNCTRYSIHDSKIKGVFTGELGYRAFCTRRRALRVPHTPGPDVVESVGWRP